MFKSHNCCRTLAVRKRARLPHSAWQAVAAYVEILCTRKSPACLGDIIAAKILPGRELVLFQLTYYSITCLSYMHDSSTAVRC